jgi:predicted permease
MLFVNKILPVFLLMLIGWFCAKVKLVDKKISSSLLSFAIFPLVPALVFLATSQINFKDMVYYRFWVSYILVSLLITVISTFILFFIFRKKGLRALLGGLFTSISNTALIGLPIALSILGKEAVFAFTISLILAFVIFIPLFLVVIDIMKGKRGSVVGFILLIFKNPIIIAIVLGLLFSILHIPLPIFVKHTLGFFSQALIATALFAVGLTLQGFGLNKSYKEVLFITFSCLILKPLIAYGIGSLFGLSEFFLACLVIYNSVPAAKILFVFTSQNKVYEKEAANIISMSTLFSIGTIPLVIYIFDMLHPGVFMTTVHNSLF